MEELKKGSLEADEKARTYFQNAIDLDSTFGRAYTGMSLTYFNEWSCQLWNRWEVSQKGAFDWALKAVQVNQMDHIGTTILGRVYLFLGAFEEAEHFTRKALHLNPNDPSNLSLLASSLTFLGYQEESYQLYLRAKRLNPINEAAFISNGIFIQFERGKYREVISMNKMNDWNNGWVDLPVYIAAAYFMVGDHEQMNLYWQKFLDSFTQKINKGQPTTSQKALQWMIDINPYQYESKLKPFWDFISHGNWKQPIASIPKTFSSRNEPSINQFSKEGSIWHLSYQGVQVQMASLKGFKDIATLLNSPDTSFHCTELLGVSNLDKGEAVFDEKAKKDYQNKIVEIQEAIADAESLHQYDRIAKLQEEYDQLLDHLSQSTGLGGKTRQSNNSQDKARSAVTWRIRNAIKKITLQHPLLGKHLETCIKTGLLLCIPTRI